MFSAFGRQKANDQRRTPVGWLVDLRLLKNAGQQIFCPFIAASYRTNTASILDQGREGGESPGKNTQAVSTIQAMNAQTGAAAEQQTAVAEQMNRGTAHVHTASEHTACSSTTPAQSSALRVEPDVQLQANARNFQVREMDAVAVA